MRNTLKTVLLLGGIGALLATGGGLIGGRGGTLVGMGTGLAVAGASWWFSDRLAIRAARARRMETHEAAALEAMVCELAPRAHLPPPRLYLSPSPQPNAFTTGRSPKHAVVVVTEGLLALLEPAEVRAVLAHELAHIGRRDTLLTAVAAAVATAVSAPCRGRSRDESPRPLAALRGGLVAPLSACVLQLALSRRREFDADLTGADLAGDGEALACALTRIAGYVPVVPMVVTPPQAQAWVVSPLGPGVTFARLFSTHPPVTERVARLRAQAIH